MRSYLFIFIFQLFMFYIFPLFCGPTDAMGMVFLIIVSTFINSIIIGISNFKYKYYYPLFVSIGFIPSIFLYYNESALIHSLWYLIVSFIGIIISFLIKCLITFINKIE